MVLQRGLRWTALGIVIGLVAAFITLRTMSQFLYGIEPTDASTFAGVSTTLFGVAALACYVPARRATRVDPVVAMRPE